MNKLLHLSNVLVVLGLMYAPSLPAVTDPVPSAPGAYGLAFDVSNGEQRAYGLYLPPAYDPLRPEPYSVVAMFHGGGQSAFSFAGRPGMQALQGLVDARDSEVVVFLQGRRGTSVTTRGIWDPGGIVKDDVLYTQELLDYLGASLNTDPDRVFAAGFSNGGRMVHELGAQDPGRFLAIAAVAGYYGTTVAEPVPPPAGTLLPVLIVHGDADPTVPYLGGPTLFVGDFLSAQDAYDRWYANDGCTLISYTIYLADSDYLTTACEFGTFRNIIKFYTVYNHGHSWPVAADGLDASASMLQFFDQQ